VRRTITSVKHEHVARVRGLGSREARLRQGQCVVEGGLLIQQAIRSGIRPDFVLTDGARGSGSPAAEAGRLGAQAGAAVFPASGAVLRHALRSSKPVDAVAVVPVPVENGPDGVPGEFAVVLDGVVDPGNLGTIARTARALGVCDLVCTDADTDLTSRRVLDASRCAALRCAVRRYDSPAGALAGLREGGFEIVATTPTAEVSQSQARLGGGPVALVLGGETEGVSQAVLEGADHLVRIPMADGVESLNVGVAAGLSIHELRRQQQIARVLKPAERDRLHTLLA
jgi:TrmH family RNA methyltransferase